MLSVLLVATAWATAPDKFGIGGRWQGAGGGGTAIVDDGTSALLNPAGLSRIRQPTFAVGISAGMPNLQPIPDLYWDTNQDGSLDDNDDPLPFSAAVDPMVGVQLQMSRNIGGKFGVGLTAYVPTRGLIRFSTFEPDLPNYFMWDNRPQRYVAAAGIGGNVLPGVAIGAAVDILAKAKVNFNATLDAGLTGPDTGDEELTDLIGDVVLDVHDIELALVPAAAPIIGVQLDFGEWTDALEGLVVGTTYRGAAGLDITADLGIQANLAAEDVGELDPFVFAAILDISMGLADHYQPARLTSGIAYRRAETFFVYLDFRWTWWSRMVDELNVAHVASADLTSPLIDLSGLVTDGNVYEVQLKNTAGVRMGVDLKLPKAELSNKFDYLQVSLRGGFGLDPTPLVGQSDNAALLDTDRTFFTLGAGFEHWDPADLTGGAVRYDLFAQYHLLTNGSLPRSTDVPRAGFPVETDALPVGGSIWVLGAQWGFDY